MCKSKSHLSDCYFFQSIHSISRGKPICGDQSVECTCQLHDPAECDSADDGAADSAVQEALLQSDPRLAHPVLTDAVVPVLLLVYRVSIHCTVIAVFVNCHCQLSYCYYQKKD